VASRDTSLDYLLDLDGQVLVLHSDGYWVKFTVRRVPDTLERPHGLAYSLTLHGPDNERIVGFDNAHRAPRARRGEPNDHQHRNDSIRRYVYRDAASLLEAFWTAVDKTLCERGLNP
jgi:hypothetical protein